MRREGIDRRRLREQLLAAEKSRLHLVAHGTLRVGVGYPNTYHVAMSSLAFQWVVELTAAVPGVGVERFFADPALAGTTLDTGTPLTELDLLAWSCSFELDAVSLLRQLDAAGIPRRARDRGDQHPLVVVGGPLASINPLPLAPAVDVFCLGAAERSWPPLLELAQIRPGRGRLLEELAGRDGYFVPSLHLDSSGRPLRHLLRLEKLELEGTERNGVPASHCVTPHTEYRGRALVEISRGCPEKCRYCWVSYSTGRLRCYPLPAILARLEQLEPLTRRVGLVATAIGDHPDLARILEACLTNGMDVAVSSLRVPAMVPEVLQPLVASGARSVTIAPETGSESLRFRLGKRISDAAILEAMRTAGRCGLHAVKLYFIVGLPEESDEDLAAIASLLGSCRQAMAAGASAVRAAVQPLVPKPYTPYSGEAMLSRSEWRRRLAVIETALGRQHISLDRASHAEAMWQGYLSRADATAFELLCQAASGLPLRQLLRERRGEIEGLTLVRAPGRPLLAIAQAAT